MKKKNSTLNVFFLFLYQDPIETEQCIIIIIIIIFVSQLVFIIIAAQTRLGPDHEFRLVPTC